MPNYGNVKLKHRDMKNFLMAISAVLLKVSVKTILAFLAVILILLVSAVAIAGIKYEMGSQSPSSQKQILLSTKPDFDFVAWSNTVSKEEAKTELKEFINNNFDSWEEAEEWLVARGFEVEEPYASPDPSGPTGLGLVVWSTKKHGQTIFAKGSWIDSYGTNIYFSYTKEHFVISHIEIDESRL